MIATRELSVARSSAPIEIEVAHPAAGRSSVDDALLADRVAGCAADLLADLELPAAPRVQVSRGPPRHPGACVAIAIEGRPCRQQADLPLQDATDDVEGWAWSACAALHANRPRLLTPRVLEALAAAHGPDTVALLPDLVRRGCSLGLAREAVRVRDRHLEGESRAYQLDLLVAHNFPAAVTLEVGAALHQVASDSRPKIAEAVGLMRDALFYELGIPFPPVRLVRNVAIAANGFRVSVGRVRGPVTRGLRPDEHLVSMTPAELEPLGIRGRPALNPGSGGAGAIVASRQDADRCEQVAVATTWNAWGYVILTLATVLRSHADAFLTVTRVQRMLSKLSEAFPLSVVDLLERFSPTFIATVLRLLVAEQVGIRDLRTIIEALLELNGYVNDPGEGSVIVAPPTACLARSAPDGLPRPHVHADYVRRVLGRQLARALHQAGAEVIETTAGTESLLRGPGDDVAPTDRDALLAALQRFTRGPAGHRPLAIMTASGVRRRLRRAIAVEYPRMQVLARDELVGGPAPPVVGGIDVAGGDRPRAIGTPGATREKPTTA